MTIQIRPAVGHSPTFLWNAGAGFNTMRETGLGKLATIGPWVLQDDDTWLASRAMWACSVGQTDNVRIKVSWHHPEVSHKLSQVGPCGCIDPTNNFKEIGLTHHNDVTINSGGYSFGVFRSGGREHFEAGLYQPIVPGSGSGPENHPMTAGAGPTVITMTCTNGRYTIQWGNRTAVNNLARPAWATGRDLWGVHVVNIQPPVGAPSFVPGSGYSGPPIVELDPPLTIDIEVTAL